jgi:ribosomal protein S18 acetylase RimI-like enzyme
MLRLRPAVVTDIDDLIPLLEQLFSIEQDFSINPEKQRRGLEMLLQSDAAYVAVAELAGEVVGMASLQVVISTAEGGRAGLVEDVVVSVSHQDRGIGRSLLLHLTDWAADNNLTRLQLLADQDNQPALAFYEKNNWIRTRLLAFRKSLS